MAAHPEAPHSHVQAVLNGRWRRRNRTGHGHLPGVAVPQFCARVASRFISDGRSLPAIRSFAQNPGNSCNKAALAPVIRPRTAPLFRAPEYRSEKLSMVSRQQGPTICDIKGTSGGITMAIRQPTVAPIAVFAGGQPGTSCRPAPDRLSSLFRQYPRRRQRTRAGKTALGQFRAPLPPGAQAPGEAAPLRGG